MSHSLEDLLRAACAPDPERAEALWARYRATGDGDAFTTLVAWYGAGVYRRALFAVGFDRPLAEEVFQTAFRKLHERRGDAACETFAAAQGRLRATVANEARTALRARRRARAWETAAAIDPATAAVPGPDAELLRREVFAELAAAFNRLKKEQQEILALLYFEGQTETRAAELLGRNRETVSRWARRGLERLRELLAARGVLPAAGGIAGVGTLLADAARAGLPPDRIATTATTILAGAAAASPVASAPGPGWLRPGVLLLGVAAVGGLAVGGGSRPRPETPAAPTSPPTAANPAGVGTLQERNLRLLRAEVIPRLLPELQKMAPNNPVLLVDARAFGSEVECEFRTERALLWGSKPAGMRVRFCVRQRQAVWWADLDGSGWWDRIDPDRTRFLEAPFPGLGALRVDLTTGLSKAVAGVIDLLPPDKRAEAELVRHLFGPPGGELLLPADPRGVSGFDGGLILATGGRGLFVRDTSGRWRYAGECPGWFPVAAGDRVYCHAGAAVWSRPLATPAAAWEKWCDQPALAPGESVGVLFLAGGRLHLTIQPGSVYSRPIADPAAGWERAANTLWPDGLAVVGDTLFGNDRKRLYARPVGDPAAWVPVSSWPPAVGSTEYDTLVADGDRLLALSRNGPIYSRPATRHDAKWERIGRVHDPYER